MHSLLPEAVAQRQLDAYNARDLDGYIATYDRHARQYEFPGTLLASGHAEIRKRYIERFKEPDLYARLLKRTVMGHIVIDHESVQRTFPEGLAHVEMICIYDIRDGRIRNASFVFGPALTVFEQA